MENLKTHLPVTLPPEGCSRWANIKPYSPVCKETFRRLSMEGKAPQPIRMGIRCTFYKNSELLRWLTDPLNYRAEALSK